MSPLRSPEEQAPSSSELLVQTSTLSPTLATPEVCAHLTGGGYAEKVVVPEGQLLPVTEGVSLTDAASLPLLLEVPMASDRTQVEAKEVRLSDMPPVTLDDSNVHTKTDDNAEMNIAEDLDNRPSKKQKFLNQVFWSHHQCQQLCQHLIQFMNVLNRLCLNQIIK